MKIEYKYIDLKKDGNNFVTKNVTLLLIRGVKNTKSMTTTKLFFSITIQYISAIHCPNFIKIG